MLHWHTAGRGGIAIAAPPRFGAPAALPADKCARILQCVAGPICALHHHGTPELRPPPCNDPAHSPPYHHISLQAAGVVRRASHDVPPARQLRPEAAGSLAHDQARAHDDALGARRVRQLRDDRRLSRARRPRSCASRATSGSTTRRRMRPISRSRTTPRNIPFTYSARGDVGPAAGDHAAVSRSRPGHPQLGAASSCARAAPPTPACC